MSAQTDRLTLILSQTMPKFQELTTYRWSEKADPEKWSRKEVLGHLIDSAQNNLRRFIVTQYQENQKIVYQQNDWVNLQGYQLANVHDLIEFWRLINVQVIRVCEAMPEEVLTRTCDTGRDQVEPKTIAFLIEDYCDHLEHHLGQII
jgi:hypothetical protein